MLRTALLLTLCALPALAGRPMDVDLAVDSPGKRFHCFYQSGQSPVVLQERQADGTFLEVARWMPDMPQPERIWLTEQGVVTIAATTVGPRCNRTGLLVVRFDRKGTETGRVHSDAWFGESPRPEQWDFSGLQKAARSADTLRLSVAWRDYSQSGGLVNLPPAERKATVAIDLASGAAKVVDSARTTQPVSTAVARAVSEPSPLRWAAAGAGVLALFGLVLWRRRER